MRGLQVLRAAGPKETVSLRSQSVRAWPWAVESLHPLLQLWPTSRGYLPTEAFVDSAQESQIVAALSRPRMGIVADTDAQVVDFGANFS